MNWLFRPERGGFVFLRFVAMLITLGGIALAVLFLLIGLLASMGAGGPLMRGTLLGQGVVMVPVALAIAAGGHLLRALALVLADRLGD